MNTQTPRKIITVIGGSSKTGDTADRDEEICRQLGILLAEQEEDYIIQTGGSGGFPAFLSDAYALRRLELNKSIDDLVIHYVPKGKEWTTKGLIGKTLACGKNRFERRENLLKLKANVVLAISGSDGTADEINLGHKNNQKVICFVGSGRASSGKYRDRNGNKPIIPENCLRNEIISNKNPNGDIDKIVNELFQMIFSK